MRYSALKLATFIPFQASTVNATDLPTTVADHIDPAEKQEDYRDAQLVRNLARVP
jgi:hypothetical protein